MTNLFAYGTLMWPEVLQAIIGRRIEGEPAVLKGYQRLRVKGAHYPVIVPSAEHAVEGKLYVGLSKRELGALDAFEGEEYDRNTVRVGGMRAQAYVLSPEWRHVASSEPWEPEQFKPEHFGSLGLDIGHE